MTKIVLIAKFNSKYVMIFENIIHWYMCKYLEINDM